MAIRSNDARRASIKNQRDPADLICGGISDHSESTLQSGHRSASRSTVQPGTFSGTDEQAAGRRHSARRWLSSALSAGALGLILCGAPGCTTTSGLAGAIGDGHCIDEFMIGYRNRALAEKAWHCQKKQFCNQQHSNEFKEGFIEGFMEVASGGNGCVPAIAPKQYWGWRYQSAQGQNAVNAWFQGYPMGVRAGEQAGVGNWGDIRTAGNHSQAPQATPPNGGANPFYGNPASVGQPYEGGAIHESINGPALQAPVMDSGFDGFGPVDLGPSNTIEGVIDMDFDSASTGTSPRQSGFGNGPVFSDANDARIAGLQDAAENVDVDVDEVFGTANEADSAVGDALPFSFE